MKTYDLLIPVAAKDLEIFPYCIGSIRHLTPAPDSLFVVTPDPHAVRKILDERGIAANVCSDSSALSFPGGTKRRWYQQFVKMFQPFTGDKYLVLDSDVVLLEEFHLFDNERRTILRRSPLSGRVNDHFREFMREAFGIEPAGRGSMVCHHMMFRRSVWMEILKKFISLHPNTGECSDVEWFYRWLCGKDKAYDIKISEYETYAQYVLGKCGDWYSVMNFPLYEMMFYGGARTAAIEACILDAKKRNAPMAVLHGRANVTEPEWGEQ